MPKKKKTELTMTAGNEMTFRGVVRGANIRIPKDVTRTPTVAITIEGALGDDVSIESLIPHFNRGVEVRLIPIQETLDFMTE